MIGGERAMTPDSGIGASVLRLEDQTAPDRQGAIRVGSCRTRRAPLPLRPVRSRPRGDTGHRDLRGERRPRRVGAVLTGADMAADGIGSMPCLWKIPHQGRDADGGAAALGARARDRVRHVGEPVAAVLVETQAAADDAAEQVEIRYRELPAAIGSRATQSEDGAANAARRGYRAMCATSGGRGDEAAVDRALETAHRTVEIDVYNNRIAGAAIEPRAAGGDLRSDRRGGHPLRQHTHPGGPSGPAVGGGPARHGGPPDPGGLPRCRRRVRLQGKALSGRDRRLLGGAASRPAGQVGRLAQRGLRHRHPGARPSHPGAAGARRGRPFPRAQGRDDRRSRSVSFDLRRGDPERDLFRAARRRLRHPRGVCRGDRRVHQHGADGRLSRRGGRPEACYRPRAAGGPRGRRPPGSIPSRYDAAT